MWGNDRKKIQYLLCNGQRFLCYLDGSPCKEITMNLWLFVMNFDHKYNHTEKRKTWPRPVVRETFWRSWRPEKKDPLKDTLGEQKTVTGVVGGQDFMKCGNLPCRSQYTPLMVKWLHWENLRTWSGTDVVCYFLLSFILCEFSFSLSLSNFIYLWETTYQLVPLTAAAHPSEVFWEWNRLRI